jgi:hypothetical protein
MLPRVVNSLLVALMLGCPCWCKSGLASASDSCCGRRVEPVVEPPRCCQHCQRAEQAKPASPEQESAPRDHSPQNSGCRNCQCVCGGAVLASATQLLLLDEVTVALPPLLIDTSPACRGGHFISDDAPTRSASGAITGRELRFRIASLLC